MTVVDERALSARRSKASLRDVLRVAMRAFKVGVRTLIPARVVTYNPATQKADVSLEHLTVRYTEGGEEPDLPILVPQVPVQWPSTLGGILHLPTVPGDTGSLIISDRSLQKWIQQGIPTDPQLRQFHNVADGVFFPGLHPDTAPKVLPPSAAVNAILDGTVGVEIGAGAVDPVVTASALQAYLVTLFTAAAVVAMDGGAAFKANLISLVAGGAGVLPVPGVPPPIGPLLAPAPAGAAATKAKAL